MKNILTIAASDSSGGAGIQADIKTISALGGYPASALTALTAQNTVGVSSINEVPSDFIAQQIDAVFEDIGVDAVKTGMLFSRGAVDAVASAIARHRPAVVVVDPVMRSTSGHSLLADDVCTERIEKLLKNAFVVTPNLAEASVLAGINVDSPDTMRDAARKIHALGPRFVLITGGHLEEECCDILYDGVDFMSYSETRIPTRNTHGTGCTLSAALATLLAQGSPVHTAVKAAKCFVETALRNSITIGAGSSPVQPLAQTLRDAGCYHCAQALQKAFCLLFDAGIGNLLPEIQSNFGYALPQAATPEDVVAFPGRIIRDGTTIARIHEPAPGGSRHIAKIILTVIGFDASRRAAMNIAWSPRIIECCTSLGFLVGEFDRSQEPDDIKEREGSSLEWGTRQVLLHSPSVPDMIFDRGDVGKEPIVRVLGTDPFDVADKIITIAQEIQKTC